MVSVTSLIVAVRTTGTASLTRLSTQFTAARASATRLNSSVTTLTRGFFAHQRQVSSVAGAYRAANGLWYNSNGTLVTQRNHVRTLTTAWGRLSNGLSRAGRSMNSVAHSAANLGTRLRSSAADAGQEMLKFLMKWGSIAVGLVPLIIPLSGSLVSLLNLLQLAAPAAIGAASALIVLKMATSGFGDAIKAGMSGDTKKFNESLKKLAPSAREAAVAVVAMAKEWKRTQQLVQNRFWIGAADDVRTFTGVLQPVVHRWLPKIADGFGRARHAITQVFTESGRTGQLDTIFAGVTKGVNAMLMALRPVARILLDVAEVAAPMFARLGVAIEAVATKLADWFKDKKDSGQLKMWLEEAVKAFNSLKDIVVNVGRIFGAFFRSGRDQGQGMLDTIEAMTDRLATWLEGTDGQQFVKAMADVGKAIVEVSVFIIALSGAIGGLMNMWQQHKDVAYAYWNMVVDTFRAGVLAMIDGLGLVLWAAVKAFGWIPGIGDKLRAAQKEFEDFRNGVNNALNGIKKNTDVSVTVSVRTVGDASKLVKSGQAVRAGNIIGYASGTRSARPGLAMVGESGPELVDFRGGEQVYTADQTSRMGSAGRPLSGSGAVRALEVRGSGPLATLLAHMLRTGDLRLVDSAGGEVRVG